MLTVLLALVSFSSVWISVDSSNQRLVIVLLDGMRWDYVTRDPSLKALPRIAREGVRAQYVTPIYPSISYPNWYTIVTGLYAENHGMIGNDMYDPAREESFDINPGRSHEEHWWNKTEPLWITAEKNGRRTAMHYWDGCQVSFRGVKPSVCDDNKPFEGWTSARKDTTKKLKGVLDWFGKSDKNRLALVYYEGPDAVGHKFGPESSELFQEVRDTDEMLGKFLEELDDSKLKNEVNLMIVSDHGMTDIQKNQVIRYDELMLNDVTEKFVGGGAYGTILPKEGRTDEVLRRLNETPVKGMKVYRKEDIPEKFHYKSGKLTLPVLLVADMGFYIAEPGSDIRTKPKKAGTHGYDPYLENSPMRTIMYAKGPAFKRGIVGGPIEQTDHYNIFCDILDIRALPNNGSWRRVSGLLEIPGDGANIASFNLSLFCSLLLIIFFSQL